MRTWMDITFTPSVKAAQTRRGSRDGYARMEAQGTTRTFVDAGVAEFIANARSFYLATASSDGQPYIQHRGGPPGFLRVIDENTLAFADFSGNRQYISTGNLDENPKAMIFIMDYRTRRRVKIWGTAKVVENDDALIERLMPDNYVARAEAAIVFTVDSWDTNCHQHIPLMVFAEDVETLAERVTALEAENARLRKQLTDKHSPSGDTPWTAHRSYPKTPGFRLGVYVFKDAEIVDFAAPHGVFSVARRLDPELDAFLVSDAMRPVQAQAGLTVIPNYSFSDSPDMDAFLIPGGFGTRQEMHNKRLHDFIRSLPEKTLITSVCTGSWIYGAMGLLDGLPATNRKEPDRLEASGAGKVPIDRLAEIAPKAKISLARVVDAGRILTAGGIASGMEMGFHLLRRAGYPEDFISEVARIMEYAAAYEVYRNDIEYAG